MCVAVSCVLLAVCLSFGVVTVGSLCVVRRALFVCCMLSVVRCLLCVACLLVACCSLCLVGVVCRVLFVVLFVVCLAFVVFGVRS